MSDTSTHNFVDFWAIHSEKDGMPALADWAKSEREAEQKMADLQKSCAEPEKTEFWVMRMTQAELDSFQLNGVIPEDA